MTQSMQPMPIPATDRSKVNDAIAEWLLEAESEPLRPGEHSYFTLCITREDSGGFTWVTERGFAKPNNGNRGGRR
jgi:hypothetical protein